MRSPWTKLRIPGRRRAMNRAGTDANGRHTASPSVVTNVAIASHYAWSQMSFEHTSQPSVRRIETTNGRWHLPSVGKAGQPGNRTRPIRRSAIAPSVERWGASTRSMRVTPLPPKPPSLQFIQSDASAGSGWDSQMGDRPSPAGRGRGKCGRAIAACAPALSGSAASSSVFALARPSLGPADVRSCDSIAQKGARI